MKGSSDEFSDANIQLALAVVQKLQEKKETKACIVSNGAFYVNADAMTFESREEIYYLIAICILGIP